MHNTPLKEEPEKRHREANHLEETEGFHVRIGVSEGPKEVNIRVLRQCCIYHKICKDVDRGTDMMEDHGLQIRVGDGAGGDVSLQRKGEVVPQ